MSKSNLTKAFSFLVSAGALGLLLGSSGCAVDSAVSTEDDAQVADDDGETIVHSIPDVNTESAERGVITQYCVLELTADGTISADARRCYGSKEERSIGEGSDGYDTLPHSKKTQESSAYVPGVYFYYVGDFYEHIDAGGAMTTVITADSNCPQINDIPSSFSGWNDRISSFRYDPGSSPYPNAGCNVVQGFEHTNYGGNYQSVQFLAADSCNGHFIWSTVANSQINVSQMGSWPTSCGQYCTKMETLNDKISSIRYYRDCTQRLQQSFDLSNTSSATVNYEKIPFSLNRSAVVKAGTTSDCGALTGAYTNADSYIRLYNAGTGQEVALNDDTACSGTSSLASYLETTVPAGSYELRIGCYGGTSCWGTAVVAINKVYP